MTGGAEYTLYDILNLLKNLQFSFCHDDKV